MKTDQKQRAREAWAILAERANCGKIPFFYSDLGSILGYHHRTARFYLGIIQNYCRMQKLPPLQALVVSKKDRLPGEGYDGSPRSKKQPAKALTRVYGHQWPKNAPF